MSMNKNLKVYIEENSSDAVELTTSYFLSNAESGIESRTKNMKVMIVIVPQKNDISMASFLRTS